MIEWRRHTKKSTRKERKREKSTLEKAMTWMNFDENVIVFLIDLDVIVTDCFASSHF